ncbi:MAG: recombinase family protein [Eubacterium sp.]|nr:recombinase family protein [Eubacterium sp.]
MVYGYARVSTRGQARDGNSLEYQEEQLRAAGAEKIYIDTYTGKVSDRPELDKLKKKLQSGDTLVVTKLDRVARSVTAGSELIDELNNRGVKVNILNMGIIDDTPTGKLLRNVMLSFAEFERDLIVQRTQEGKEIAKRKPGYREGRPRKYSKKQLEHAMELLNDYSYKQVSELTGISVSTLARTKRVSVN